MTVSCRIHEPDRKGRRAAKPRDCRGSGGVVFRERGKAGKEDDEDVCWDSSGDAEIGRSTGGEELTRCVRR